jgi:hypothetical protein
MPWYKIISEFSHEITKRHLAINELVHKRFKDNWPIGFAICNRVEYSEDMLSRHSVVYLSQVALEGCQDLLASEPMPEVCVMDPNTKEGPLSCFGDLASIPGLLK